MNADWIARSTQHCHVLLRSAGRNARLTFYFVRGRGGLYLRQTIRNVFFHSILISSIHLLTSFKYHGRAGYHEGFISSLGKRWLVSWYPRSLLAQSMVVHQEHQQCRKQGCRNKPSLIPPLVNQIGSYYRRMKSISYIPSGPYITHLFPLDFILREMCSGLHNHETVAPKSSRLSLNLHETGVSLLSCLF